MAVRFVLNGEVREVADAAPSTMLLAWLREEAGLTGTKEGCAEGDCGACTVAVGEPTEDGTALRWRAVNACILFLGSVDGKAVLTVEGLEGPDGALHPVQRALVDHHGSQCGFCTPGFVMTLFTHWWREGATDRATLDDVLAGNLCRCTGYRPILDAARAMGGVEGGDHLRAQEPEILARLDVWAGEGDRAPAPGFVAPRSLDALATHLEAYPDALVVAGATDAGLWVTKDLARYDRVVSVAEVPELRAIEIGDDQVEIGAAATYSDLLPVAERCWPSFASMLKRLGSELIRNSATLGGNLGSASPIGDCLPVLLALDAVLVLRKGAARREVAAEDFFLDYKKTLLEPGEFVERVRLPRLDEAVKLHVEKVSKRFDQDISAVLAAVCLRVEDRRISQPRVAMGGMAAIPKRAPAAEAALAGAPLDDTAFLAAAAALERDYQPLTDMRASAAYRLDAAGACLRKAGFAFQNRPVRLPDTPVEVGS
ncbi:MAG: xanthine dehydrogenase small subunit [Alphaproteobacteria bacterium]|jgi:xanthine dehydrogenase small subunit|nr:xanthine dehydrogenase small subunit [Alphaproteobacteria bacterium]